MILPEYFMLLTLGSQPMISWSLRDDKVTLTKHRLPRRFLRIISIRVSESFVTLVVYLQSDSVPGERCYILDFYGRHF